MIIQVSRIEVSFDVEIRGFGILSSVIGHCQ